MLKMFRSAVALLCLTAATTFLSTPAHADGIRGQQWHLGYLKLAAAHQISQGEGVSVAVIDTGVYPHPDLRSNLLPGLDLILGDSNGQHDTTGHGTRMAGIIAANGAPNGALGVAPKAKILPIRIKIGLEESSDESSLAAGVEWAVKNQAKVINLSVRGEPSTAEQEAIDTAIQAGIVVVASAGNTTQGDVGIRWPARQEGVVAVGGTDKKGNHGSFSVIGKQLTISAPGEAIVTTSPGGKYSEGTGTSDSAAIVSGAAALIRSKYPNMPAREVVHRITATATDKGAPGWDPEYGYGELNLLAALTANVPPLSPEPTLNHTDAKSSPSPTRYGAAYNKTRNDNTAATIAVVSIASLLATGLVVAFVALRIRDRRNASSKK